MQTYADACPHFASSPLPWIITLSGQTQLFMKSNQKKTPKLHLQNGQLNLTINLQRYHFTLGDHLGLFRLSRVHQLAQHTCPGTKPSQEPLPLGEAILPPSTGQLPIGTNDSTTFRIPKKIAAADFQDSESPLEAGKIKQNWRCFFCHGKIPDMDFQVSKLNPILHKFQKSLENPQDEMYIEQI